MKTIEATKGYYFFIDDEDEALIRSFLWYTKTTKSLSFHSDLNQQNIKFAENHIKHLVNAKARTAITPAELIVEYDKSTHFISFVNHKRNDFRRENLRIIPNEYVKLHRASPSKNTCMYRGVELDKTKTSYEVSIYPVVDGVRKSIRKSGFVSAESAALAYNEMAKEYYGEYAYLNIIGEDSRKPAYLTIEETEAKRSLNSLTKGTHNASSGFTATYRKRHLLHTDDINVASFAYNLAALQDLGDKADINQISEEFEWYKVFFAKAFSFNGLSYASLFEACRIEYVDAPSVLSLAQFFPLHEAFEMVSSSGSVIDKNIQFNKRKNLFSAYLDSVFLGYFKTLRDAQYAFNKNSQVDVYTLPPTFKGSPFVEGVDATLVYNEKLYPSVYSLGRELGISVHAVRNHYSMLGCEGLKNIKSPSHPVTIDGVTYPSLQVMYKMLKVNQSTYYYVKNILIGLYGSTNPQAVLDRIRLEHQDIKIGGTTYKGITTYLKSPEAILPAAYYAAKRELEDLGYYPNEDTVVRYAKLTKGERNTDTLVIEERPLKIPPKQKYRWLVEQFEIRNFNYTVQDILECYRASSARREAFIDSYIQAKTESDDVSS